MRVFGREWLKICTLSCSVSGLLLRLLRESRMVLCEQMGTVCLISRSLRLAQNLKPDGLFLPVLLWQ